jgi:carbon storage regulator
MLILTRREGESVRIGDDVTVRVLGMKKGQVRIGVAAPKEIPVHREEVYHRISMARAAPVEPPVSLRELRGALESID